MKDIFDNPNFGEFNLNSRIVRTGLGVPKRVPEEFICGYFFKV